MRRLSIALVVVAGLALPLSFNGCLSDDNAAGSADSGSFDGNAIVVEPGFDASGSDGASFDATVNDTGSVDGNTPTNDDDASDATPFDASDATPFDASDATPFDAGPQANLRFVNLVPDLATAVDVCAAAQGGPLEGPFLKLAGVNAGLAYGEMTQYVQVPLVNQFQIRVVAADSTSCATPLIPDITNVPGATAQRATVTLMGSAADAGGHTPSLHVFADDDPATAPANGGRIRVVHAAPLSAATDFEIGAGIYSAKQQTAIAYGAATSSASMVSGSSPTDANGYFTESLFTAQITATRTSDITSFVADYSSSSWSLFLVGLEGSGTTPPALLVCSDLATPSGFKIPCTLHTAPPTFTQLRVLHIVPSAPAVDVCLSILGYPTTFGPFLQNAGVAAGVSYKQITGDLGLIPTDTNLSVKFVSAGGDCTSLYATVDSYFFGQPGITDQAVMFAEDFTFSDLTGDVVYTSNAGTPGYATVGFSGVDFAHGSSNANDFALVDTQPDGGVVTLIPDVNPLEGVFYQPIPPGTHSMKLVALDGGSTILAQSGMVFAANQLWLLQYYDTSASATALLRCNLAQPSAGTVTTCLP